MSVLCWYRLRVARPLLGIARQFGRAQRGAEEVDRVFDASLEVSELAAWTTIASIILNLDETITKA